MTRGRRHPNQRLRTSLPPELWRAPVPAPVRAWCERHAGARLVDVRRLPGASSTAVHGLRFADGTRLVLRRYAWPGFLEAEPEAPQREAEALAFAGRHQLPVPEVLAADVGGGEVGDGIPAILMTLVPGRPVAVPEVSRLAEVAARIHDVDPTGFGHAYFPWYQGTTAEPPAAAGRPELWEQALVLWRHAMPAFRPGLVHRDFHPGNVLWRRGRPTGIVDWANACAGPWGCDVAHCRWNLINLAGLEVADAFLARYEAITGRQYHPFWDLASILEHGPSHWTPATTRQAEQRLEPIIASITGVGRRP